MKALVKYSLLALVFALGTSTAANAKPEGWYSPPKPKYEPPPPPPKCDPVAPEVDPGLAIGAFSLLAGGLTVLRARRSK